MTSRELELAAEFCALVGAQDLLAYLGAESDDDGDAIRGKLKSRRRFMQGMQNNPKYKREALFLIRHFTSLDAVLGDIPAYLDDARERAESVHLPVLEMTIRGVLAAGPLSPDQEEYLRHNARELGVSDGTFERVLAKAADELGVAVPPDLDLYRVLGIPTDATEEVVLRAAEARLAQATEEVHRAQIEHARTVLSDPAARRAYDRNSANTGPPASERHHTPQATVHADGEDGLPVLDVEAPHVRKLRIEPRAAWLGGTDLRDGIAVASVKVINRGDGPMHGGVRTDVSWLAVDPTRLDPDADEQVLSVQADPTDIPRDHTLGTVRVETDDGQVAEVVFHLRRGWPFAFVASVFAGALLAIAALLGALLAG